jgi:hypothetical protein
MFANVEERADVGMLERGDCARFPIESFTSSRVGGESSREDLDRDDALKTCIERAVHLAHAAGAEGGLDLVRAEVIARGESHRGDADYSGGLVTARAGLLLSDGEGASDPIRPIQKSLGD